MPKRSYCSPLLSISDDDVCAKCVRLHYRPGEMSACAVRLEDGSWPALFNRDGYAVSCRKFVKRQEQSETVNQPSFDQQYATT